MIEYRVDEEIQTRVAEARELGRKELRPAGLDADRKGAPIPRDDPFFDRCIERGEGRTSWAGPGEARPKRRRRSIVEGLLVAEELAYWDRGVINSMPGPGLPENNVLSMGTDEQKERFLGPFLEPDRPRWACFGMTEPGAGSDAAAIRTSAKKDGDGWILNGAKCFIGGASRADWILVQATIDSSKGRSAQRAFFVEQGTPGLGGFKIEKKMGLKAYESTSFSLEDVRVPESARMPEAEGLKAPLGCLTAARYGIAWGGLGAALACFDEALQYSKERIVFDKPLAGFQLAQKKLADMATEITCAQLMTLRLGRLKDAGEVTPQQISMAKRNSCQKALEITRVCRDMLGANGISLEYQVGRHMCNLESVYTYEGTHDIHTLAIGQELTGLQAFR